MSTQPATAASTGAGVEFHDVSLRYGPVGTDPVLTDLSLAIDPGEFFVIVGPSGCGKSTLLRMVAGYLSPTTGDVTTAGGPVIGPGRDRAMVFQSVDGPLFDWLTVRQNVEFGLRMQARHADFDYDRDDVDRWLAAVGLSTAARKLPSELSGGMKQRVQIARILAVQPDVVLMDEPFAALDAQSRRLLQSQVIDLWQQHRSTYIYVTHDIREAVLLGQRIGIMSAGPNAGFRSIHTVDLPHPRDEFDPAFAEIARAVEDEIIEEVTRAWEHEQQ